MRFIFLTVFLRFKKKVILLHLFITYLKAIYGKIFKIHDTFIYAESATRGTRVNINTCPVCLLEKYMALLENVFCTLIS